MTIKIRTAKMVLATLLSIYIANLLQLEHTLAAGIIAILSLLDTKRASFVTAFKRLLSTLTAFMIASIVFCFVGFTIPAFAIYLMFYVPIAYRFDLQVGIAPCSVLVTHFIGAASIALAWQVNGLLLMFIGASSALLFNSWMPSSKSELEESKVSIDENLRVILRAISTLLFGRELDIKLGTKITQVEKMIEHTKNTALIDYDNQLFRKNDYSIRYLQMRQQQLVLIKKMSFSLQHVTLGTVQSRILAELFFDTAEQLNEKNTGLLLLSNIATLYKEFRQSELPKTREEFESRAYLFQLLHDVEELIEVKRAFFTDKEDSEDEEK
ncbi:MAG: aromatic acid exporter family protein [Alkalibacterium sp.]|nr:aromatic acid exporter family protein [Alkalibacterium sp.]